MKRYVIAVALGLILVFSLSLDGTAKQRPDHIPGEMTDDHTWGGENGFGDSINPGDEGFQSSLRPWQQIINRFVLLVVPQGKTGVVKTELRVAEPANDNQRQTSTGNVQSSKGN